MKSKISNYVTYAEGVKSQTAERKGIDNTPSEMQLDNMKHVAENIFDRVRLYVGGPLAVSSFFRSPELCVAIGSSTKSQHAKGEAIDIDGDPYGADNKIIFDFIRAKCDFDQLIWEFGTTEKPAWVHVSLKKHGENRKQVLRALHGGTYIPFDLY